MTKKTIATGRKPSGRPRKPTAMKELAGTERKSRRKREPKPRKGIAPPKWLSKESLAEWNRLAPELERLGLLTIVDRAQFARFCDALAGYAAMTKEIETRGRIAEQGKNGHRQEIAEVSLQKKYGEIIGQLAGRFGLDPSARASLDILPGNLSPGGGEETNAGKEDEPEESIVDRRLRLA